MTTGPSEEIDKGLAHAWQWPRTILRCRLLDEVAFSVPEVETLDVQADG
jgi:hypothetical protein